MSELDGLIIEVMKKLTARDRTVLSLRHVERMTFSEIANILEANFFAVWIYYLKARRKLRRQLLIMGYGKSSSDCVIGLFGRLFAPPNRLALPLRDS
jgi:DNA-directed RNA polymerase specialized sigma24 family protein